MVDLEDLENFNVNELPLKARLDATYDGTKELYNFCKEIIIPAVQSLVNPGPNEDAIRGAYYRMFLLLESAISLNHTKFFQTTASTTRSLFELLLDIKFLSDDEGGSWTKKYHAFPEVDKFNIATKLVKFDQSNPRILAKDIAIQKDYIENTERIKRINENIISNWGRDKNGQPQKPRHWTGMNIDSRAHIFGLDCEAMYLEIFPNLSLYVHSGSTGYAGISKEGLESCFGLCHRQIQRIVIEATAICSKVLKIDEAVRHQLNDSLDNILEKIKLAPGRFIVEEQIKILKKTKKSGN